MGLVKVKLEPELSMPKMFSERPVWQTIVKCLLGSDFLCQRIARFQSRFGSSYHCTRMLGVFLRQNSHKYCFIIGLLFGQTHSTINIVLCVEALRQECFYPILTTQ
jgi:hypothetical protein